MLDKIIYTTIKRKFCSVMTRKNLRLTFYIFGDQDINKKLIKKWSSIAKVSMCRLSLCFPECVESKNPMLIFFFLFVLTCIGQTVRDRVKKENLFLNFVLLCIKHPPQWVKKNGVNPLKKNVQWGPFSQFTFSSFWQSSSRAPF